MWTSNEEHICIEYDEAHPCPQCGAPSIYAFAGAPGIGGAWVCQNNHHYDSTIRILTPEECV